MHFFKNLFFCVIIWYSEIFQVFIKEISVETITAIIIAIIFHLDFILTKRIGITIIISESVSLTYCNYFGFHLHRKK